MRTSNNVTFHQHVLPNGLRLIHEPSPTGVVYCGYIVGSGTRHEEEQDSGMAHFCEHMTFKGTERRRSWHIRNSLERVGGDLNAFTNKEITVFYATVQKEDFPRAVDLLSDIVFSSVYPQSEIDKEVEVIVDEIDSYNDSPAELIYDDFEELLFKGHGLGRNILGKAERLRQYQTGDALRFTRRHYVPNNATFFILGQVDFDKAVKMVARHTAAIEPTQLVKPLQPLPPYEAQTLTCERETHQAHVLMGNRGYSIVHPDRTALFLLNNILGGPGMNSRLNVSLREQHGLVYNVESNTFSYQDTGVWSVYFGCEESKVSRCRQLVVHQLEELCSTPLSERTLSMAKKQLIGQILIAGDNFESYSIAMGKTYALTGRHRNVNAICQRIQAITAPDLMRVAQDVFSPAQLTTLIYH